MHGLPKSWPARLGALAPASGGYAGILPLGVDHERRALVEGQVRHDERNALAGTAAADGQHVPVVGPADQASRALAEQNAALVLPDIAGQFFPALASARAGRGPDLQS